MCLAAAALSAAIPKLLCTDSGGDVHDDDEKGRYIARVAAGSAG